MRHSQPPTRPTRKSVLKNRVDCREAGPTDAEIRKRAYALYLTRRGAYGDAVEDWLQAERELRGQAVRLPVEKQP